MKPRGNGSRQSRRARNDLVGQVFGRLTIVERSGHHLQPLPSGKTLRYRRWKCRCVCGAQVFTTTGRLNRGQIRSCGCLAREASAERAKGRARARRDREKLPRGVAGARWIPLGGGRFVLVDATDHDRLTAMGVWFAQKNKSRTGHVAFYAAQRPRIDGRTMPITYMHRVILDATDDEQIDHKSRNTLDCRRSNLRRAGKRGNNQNRGKHGGHKRPYSSKYKGVCRPSDFRRWKAVITVDGKSKWLPGLFDTEIEAAKAYDRAARKAFGRFACTNFGRNGLFGRAP